MRAATLQLLATGRAQRATSRRWDVFLGGLALTLGAAYGTSALAAGYAFHDGVGSLQPVIGVIDGAEVVPRRASADGSRPFAVRVHCRYPWQDRELVAATDSSCEEAPPLGYGDATQVAAALLPGAPLALLVDPREPQRAVLDNRAPRSLLPALLMLVLTGASAVLALIGWRGWPLVADARA